MRVGYREAPVTGSTTGWERVAAVLPSVESYVDGSLLQDV